MRIILTMLLLCFSGCEIYAQSYQTRDSWVSRYLEDGGDIKNITGLVRPANWLRGARWDSVEFNNDLPSHFSWNDYYKLQPIKNQQTCGSCWAFAVTAVVESLYWMRNFNSDNDWYDLAEQRLVSNCLPGNSCSGGYFNSFDFVQTEGLPHESQDPYQNNNSRCKSGVEPLQKIVDWRYVGSSRSQPTTDQIKQAIWHYGPITVDVNGNFGRYSSGIYDSCGSTAINHMVVLEGWTDDPKYEANGGGYWHMRNSWGRSWGEDGYMRIVYNSRRGQKCNGIGQVAAYAIIDGLEPQKTLKQRMSR